MALIDPCIAEAGDEMKDFDGCLSFPGLYGETVRPHLLRVTGLTEAGRSFSSLFRGFDAVVVHHEIDHLEGVLFIDRAEPSGDLYWLREGDDGRAVRVPAAVDEFRPRPARG
jgi:peptide deformylase